jgi:molybdopterin molybdotransferase
VGLLQALDRITAKDMVVSEDIPGFARSIVDGDAVRAADTFGASEGLPAYLTVVGTIAMGEAVKKALGLGQCMKIATGGMLPDRGDAVVMVEHTEILDDDTRGILSPVAPGENVIQPGEDLSAGTVLLPAGRRIRPGDLGALAAAGATKIPVVRRPRVAIISTGDELVPPEQSPAPGQIRNTNTYTLGALVERAGGEVVSREALPDRYEQLLAALETALDRADLVMISGGSSVGTKDLTAGLIDAVGSPGVLLHGLAVRPGKPTIIGLARNKPIYGLPGHPVSAMVTFDLLVRPALWHLQGLSEKRYEASVKARLSRNIASTAGREDYIRVILRREGEEVIAEPVLGKSGLISTMVNAAGLVKIPLQTEGLLAGEMVDVRLL